MLNTNKLIPVLQSKAGLCLKCQIHFQPGPPRIVASTKYGSWWIFYINKTPVYFHVGCIWLTYTKTHMQKVLTTISMHCWVQSLWFPSSVQNRRLDIAKCRNTFCCALSYVSEFINAELDCHMFEQTPLPRNDAWRELQGSDLYFLSIENTADLFHQQFSERADAGFQRNWISACCFKSFMEMIVLGS